MVFIIIVYHFDLVSSFINLYYKYYTITNESVYATNNITILNKLCGNSCYLYTRFIHSSIPYFKFVTVVDVVPSIVKCKYLYHLLIKYNLLKTAQSNDYQYQYLEINRIIYTKYINFKSVYVNKFKLFLNKINNIENSIGIHYRMTDVCFYNNNKCNINGDVNNKYYNHIKNICHNNSSILLISTINNRIANKISNGFKYIQYMPDINPIHVSITNRNITEEEISKIVGDILLIASAKYIILSAGSTFSDLILSIGGLDSNGNMKKYLLCNINGNIINISNIDYITSRKCIRAYYSNI